MADVDLDFDELADAAWTPDQPQDPVAAAKLEAEYNALLGNETVAEEAPSAHSIGRLEAADERAASIIAGTWRRRASADEGKDFAIPQSSPFAHLKPEDFDDGWVEEPQAVDPGAVEAVVETYGRATVQAADTLDDDLVNALSEAEPEELDLPQVAETAEPSGPVSTPEDPFAALAAMAARYQTGAQDSWRETSRGYETARQEPPMEAPVRSSAPAASGWPVAPAAHKPAAPDIDTVDVYDDAIALADDLNIPDLNYDEPVVDPYDDLDAEFNHLLKEMSSGDKREPALRQASAYTPASPPRQMAYQQPAQPSAPRAQHPAYVEQRDYQPRPAQQAPAQAVQDDPDFDLSGDAYFEDAMASFEADGRDDDYADFDPAIAPVAERAKPRRGLMIAAIVGGLALIGGIGAVAMSFGGIGDFGELAVIKADGKPIKVRPEGTGSATVPNQNSTVYDTVSRSASNDAPVQERLISTAEEPIELPAPNDEEMVSDEAFDDQAKDEDRVLPDVAENTAENEGEIAIAPRKVRTMVVKADGSLVPREEPSQEVTNSTPEAKPTANQETVADDEAGTEQITTGATQPTETVDAPKAPAAPEAEVAALEPAAAPAPGSWSVQVSSQPSETGANKSLKDISRKYAGVIGERGAHIVKADVAGKGTFWRVRIPAGSREEAVGLCGDLKSAGGSCFVTK